MNLFSIDHLLSVWPILGALLGWFIGYRSKLFFARRLEYNAIVDPTRAALLRDKKSPGPCADIIKCGDFDTLLGLSYFWSRGRLRAAMEAYEQAKQHHETQDAIGQPYYTNPAAIQEHIDHLLALLKRR